MKRNKPINKPQTNLVIPPTDSAEIIPDNKETKRQIFLFTYQQNKKFKYLFQNERQFQRKMTSTDRRWIMTNYYACSWRDEYIIPVWTWPGLVFAQI